MRMIQKRIGIDAGSHNKRLQSFTLLLAPLGECDADAKRYKAINQGETD